MQCFYVYINARIEPGNAFRLVVKIVKYTAVLEYDGLVEIVDQEHELWLDRSVGYSLAQFHDKMATKIIWGPSQTLSIWVLDSDNWRQKKLNSELQQLWKPLKQQQGQPTESSLLNLCL